jgi:hypothetical protein
MKLSQKLKEHFGFDTQKLNTILYNTNRYFAARKRQPLENEEFSVEYGYGDAMVVLRYYKGYLIFVNTIGCG